jgi:hypothetical protein
MEANELRALQAPLKKQYREQPETGRTPARAEATLDLDRVACRVRFLPSAALLRHRLLYPLWLWLFRHFPGLLHEIRRCVCRDRA